MIPVLTPTRLENLAEYDRTGAGPQATADAWVRAAARERSARGMAGVVNTIAGGLELAIGVGAAVYYDPHAPAADASAVFSAIMIGVGTVNAIVGISALANDGPTETALHAYERSHGIPLWKLAEHVAVAPTSGGAVGSLSFRF